VVSRPAGPDVVSGPSAADGAGFHLVLLCATATGAITGVAVAGFDAAVQPTVGWVLDRPAWMLAAIPALGLVVVYALGVLWGSSDTTTTDAYVRAYHQRDGRLTVRHAVHKVVASAVTLGSGNAFGFEGPAMLIGGTVGSSIDERFGSRLRRDDAKVLMVAGAAAGVAAVFKAPLTGVVFALEVPYRSDLARRALLPTLVASGVAYLSYVALIGTEPLLATGGSAPFDLRDLGGGVLLGACCGVLARFGAVALAHAKDIPVSGPVRVLGAATAIAVIAPLGHWWLGGPFHLGPSYETIAWATDPDRTVTVLVAVLALRALTTWLGVAGGGIGGLFIPLVTQGAIIGAICQQIVQAPNARLLPTIGIAAFLGAGYRTPLAGVAFVAEATGQPGFLVPALLAAATAQITMGPHSFSAYQRNERAPDLEPLTRLPVAEIMSPNVDTVDASLSLDRVAPEMMRRNRRWAPVTEGSRYVGLIALADVAEVSEDDWPNVTAIEMARTDLVPARPDEPVSVVAARLRASDSDAVAVIEGESVVGVVTRRDLENVELLLDRLAGDT